MAPKEKPQASPQVSFSPGAKVVDQVARAPPSDHPASRDGHRAAPIQLASMAPASSSRSPDEVAAAPSSPGGPMTRPIAPPDVPPSNSPPKIDKTFSHVEGSPTATTRRRRRPDPSPATSIASASSPAAAAAAAADAVCATVERLIGAAESRGTSARESSLANGTAPSPDDDGGGGGGGGRAFEAAALHGGPFAAHELGRLSLHCAPAVTTVGAEDGVGDGGSIVTRVSKTGAWSSLDGDALSTLAAMLRSHVTSALGVDLVGEGRDVVARCAEVDVDAAASNGGKRGRRPAITVHQWMMQAAKYAGPDSAPLGSLGDANLEPGGGYRRLQVLLCGLEAAGVLLAIMACPGIDRRAVEDDTIEACVNLIKNHIQKHLAPALSNTGHLGTISSSDARLDDDGRNGDDDGDSLSPKAKRAKTVAPNRGAVAKSLKAVYNPILSTVGSFGTILERAEEFINFNEMDDGLLFTLSAAALSSLTIDASPIVRADVASLTSIVQESAMNLIASMFGRYPRHRSIIVEDLFPLMLKLPTSKRSLRTYLVKKRSSAASSSTAASFSGGDNDFIQPICALTLLLIQSCVVMPFQSDEEGDAESRGDDKNDDEEKPASNAGDTSGLDGCDAVCNQFTSQILQRCSRKGEEGGASEFRPILSNLIDDLLHVRFMIEFPAAEMLLLSLSHRLGNDLMRASSASKSQLVEATYLATAMDAFGKITSHVAGVLRQNRENPLNLPDSMSPSELEPEEEVNRCFCGRGNLDTFMVDCDRCHSWYHGSCIGITKDTVPDQWFCDECKLQTAMLDQAKVFTRSDGGSESLTSKDHNHVLRQFLLGYLSRISQSSSSPRVEKTRQFLIASWVRDIMLQTKNSDGSGSFDLGLVRSHVIAQWSPPSQHQKYHSYAYLTDHANSRIMTTLVAHTQVSASFPQLLGVLLRLMGDGMTSLRKLSLKAFLQVANVDPALMTQPSVRKEVSRCFHDAAISVREAAVGLVGDYVLQSPNLAAAFHTPLLERLADVGISVRKRVVKIFRDILLSNPSYGGRAIAMHFMLKRAGDRKEDDGVRDLVHETFHTLWFNGKAFELGKSVLLVASDVTSNDLSNPGKIMTTSQLYSREAAKQMVEVVKVAGNSEFLTSLVHGLLFGFNEGDKDKKTAERKRRQEDSRNQCNSLVLALVELLLSFEETRAHKEEDGKELVALLSVLSVFSQAYPELLVPHIDTLVPYLKGDNAAKKFETSIVSNVSSIVSQSSSHFSSAELARLTGGGLPTDLVNIAYKFPPSAVSSAVEALANLANHPDANAGSTQEKRLLKMAVQFYTYLLKNKDFLGNDMKKSIRDNVKRALSALGSICRFYVCHDGCDSHTLDPNGFSVIMDVKLLKFSGNVLSSACFALFRIYLEQEDESTKCLALRAMNGVFISRPRVVLAAEQLGIITSVMSEAAPPSVQIETLRCWRDILLAEEKRVESGAAKEKMQAQKNVSVSQRISGDQDGDSCISGSVLTKHADRLYELTLSKDENVRYMTTDLLGHLLRQGLINPMATVPYLLAVQGDVESPATRSLALKLLINEGEKRPDMLRQRICAGLKQAFFFQKNVYPHDANGVPRVTALLTRSDGPRDITETIFDAVIKESAIQNKRALREGLLRGIISLFEKDPDSENTNIDQLPLLAFASEILAHLPYTALNDPLLIIYHSSCITALDGQTIINQFAELLGGDLCDPNSGEDGLECATKTGNFDPKDFGLKSKKSTDLFGQLCVNACRILPLLHLKSFLRKGYNIGESRMTEYVPSEKERIHEKGVSISDSTPAFSCNLDPIFDTEQQINWHNASKIYTSFRLLMRDCDAEDLHVDTEESKKSPKRRSGHKRKRGDSDDDGQETDVSPKISPD